MNLTEECWAENLLITPRTFLMFLFVKNQGYGYRFLLKYSEIGSIFKSSRNLVFLMGGSGGEGVGQLQSCSLP